MLQLINPTYQQVTCRWTRQRGCPLYWTCQRIDKAAFRHPHSASKSESEEWIQPWILKATKPNWTWKPKEKLGICFLRQTNLLEKTSLKNLNLRMVPPFHQVTQWQAVWQAPRKNFPRFVEGLEDSKWCWFFRKGCFYEFFLRDVHWLVFV